jgi:hypothetical protein
MAKGKRNIGREILQGLREIKSGRHGRVVNLPSVASIREKTGLSQERFATLLGVSQLHIATSYHPPVGKSFARYETSLGFLSRQNGAKKQWRS